MAADAPMPMAEARARFRRLLTALRLFKPGALGFGALAWARVDEGAWQPLALGVSSGAGHARGEAWVLEGEEGAFSPLRAAATICAPLDLMQTCEHMQRRRNWLYHSYILADLKKETLGEGGTLCDEEREIVDAKPSSMPGMPRPVMAMVPMVITAKVTGRYFARFP